MRKWLALLLALIGSPLLAQNPGTFMPSCRASFVFSTTGRGPVITQPTGNVTGYNNITPTGSVNTHCAGWTLSYAAIGFSALNIEVDSAPDASTTAVGTTPGSWTIWPAANVAAGQTLPLTSTSGAAATVFGFFPWVSINVTTATCPASTTCQGVAFLYGWQVQGSQESNTGSTQVQGVSSTGVASAGNPVIEGISDTSGNTQRIRPSCESPAALLQTLNIALSGTTTTQFIALAAGKAIHICSMSVGNGTGTTPTFSLQYGTGSNCATGLTTLIPNTVIPASTAAPQQWTGHMIVPSGNAACYILTGTTPTGNLTVTSVQQ